MAVWGEVAVLVKGRVVGVVFAQELSRLLAGSGWTAAFLADEAKVSRSYLSKLLRGTQSPSAAVARALDAALGAGGALAMLREVSEVPRPAQLPAAPLRWVGRTAEFARMDAALEQSQEARAPVVVSVDGPPGVGKTGLALTWAQSVAARFPDGQLYVDLCGYSPGGRATPPGEVLEGFLVALGLPAGQVPPRWEQRAAAFRTLVRGRRLVVVLDNAADADQVEPLLPGSEGCGCVVVVTSRSTLAGLAVRHDAVGIALDPLPLDEATALAEALVGSDRAWAEPAALRRVVAGCDRLPLAVRIAGQRIAGQRGATIAELVEGWSDEAARLDTLTADATTGVRAALSWSYRALPDPAARMFRLVGLVGPHRGRTIGGEAAAALAGVDPGRARRLLAVVAGTHLIEEGDRPGRFYLHDLLRAYAVERCTAEDTAQAREAAVGRVCAWYLHTAVRACRALAPSRFSPLRPVPLPEGAEPLGFTDDAAAMRWLDTELAAIPAVVELARRSGWREAAWQLPVALFDYFQIRKPWHVWVRTHEAAEQAAAEVGDRAALGWVLTNLAEAWRGQRAFARSGELYEKAIALRRAGEGVHGLAWALGGAAFLEVDRGQAAAEDGDRAEAERCFAVAGERAREAAGLFEQVGDVEGQAVMRATLGDIDRAQGRLEHAAAGLRRALELLGEVGHDYARAMAEARLAAVEAARGRRARPTCCWAEPVTGSGRCGNGGTWPRC
ncbi:ATP-binding protein [Amycolatopsis aidingensis]|uniref:ATP-binding protein n=1 Tax=Amycolatopsis aidingensis TaxID=2842453 RepID=UPI001C0C77BE|nr:helix-turn-helix domain-containing protein [Amycolatopsis aidingensis]